MAVDPITGEGEIVGGKFSNVPRRLHPMVVGRLAWNQEGMDGYSEADLKGGDLRVAVGASALVDFDGDNDDTSTLQAEVDFALKVHGFSATGAAYAATAQTEGSFKSQELDATGFHVQIGVVLAQMFQPTARFALIVPEGLDDDLREITLGFSAYVYEHDLKLQVDASQLSTQSPDGDVDDLRVRAQFQIAF